MTDCSYCQDSGFLTDGMAIGVPVRPDGAEDEIVEWVLSLTACSHPASQDSPGEAPTSTPDRDGRGVHVRLEGRGGPSEDGPAPVATLGLVPDVIVADDLASPYPWVRDEARLLHDAQVEADTAAYERNGRKS